MDRTPFAEPEFFERLCWLRGLYEHRGPRDRAVVMSIDDVLDHADSLIRDQDLLERALESAAI